MYHLDVIQRGRRRVVAAIAITGVILAAILVGRHSLLRTAGWMLVADDPIHPADAIVVAVDAGPAGALEAADLVHGGLSSRVAVFAQQPDEVERELVRRGIEHEDEQTRQSRLLRALGVGQIEQIALVTGTEDEGSVLPAWCAARSLRSIIVVTSSDHGRRLQRVMHRALKGRQTEVMVRKARHSDFDPDRWWCERRDMRTGIVEMEKLLFDFIRHPLP